MTTIYMIRHGESVANERDVFIGHTDLPLTELGQKQAEITAEYLKNIRPDAIYSSDLQRAYHTALATATPWGISVTQEMGLREIYAGDWEYVPFEKLQRQCKDTYDIWLRDIANARCDGGESVQEVGARVYKTVEKIAQNHPDQVVFLFTHATPVRTFSVQAMGKSIDELEALPWPSNASVTEVEYDEGKFALKAYSIDDFMGELATRLPDNV